MGVRRATEVASSQGRREKRVAGDEAAAESVFRELEGTRWGVGALCHLQVGIISTLY